MFFHTFTKNEISGLCLSNIKIWKMKTMKIIPAILLFNLFIGCSVKHDPFILEPQQGFIVKISNLKYHKSQKRMVGYVQINNNRSDFVKFSNQELFLICDNDSMQTFMNLPGTWEIDNGLINIIAGKTLSYQACWHIDNYFKESTLDLKYIVHLPRN